MLDMKDGLSLCTLVLTRMVMLKNPRLNVIIHIPLMQVWVTDGVLQ